MEMILLTSIGVMCLFFLLGFIYIVRTLSKSKNIMKSMAKELYYRDKQKEKKRQQHREDNSQSVPQVPSLIGSVIGSSDFLKGIYKLASSLRDAQQVKVSALSQLNNKAALLLPSPEGYTAYLIADEDFTHLQQFAVSTGDTLVTQMLKEAK